MTLMCIQDSFGEGSLPQFLLESNLHREWNLTNYSIFSSNYWLSYCRMDIKLQDN